MTSLPLNSSILSVISAVLCLSCRSDGIDRHDGTSAADAGYLRVHSAAVVADGHNDALGRIVSGEDFLNRSDRGHSDLVRFREGGVDAQVFAIWVHPSTADPYGRALAMLESLHVLDRRAGTALRVVRNRSEMDSAFSEGSLAAIAGLEGGHVIGNSRNKIIELYRRGLRCFGLTWNNSTSWASSSRDETRNRKGGLTVLGKSFIRLMDSLGIIIDISHLGARSVNDVLAASRNPVIASHSCCAALRPHDRNLTDEQLRSVARKGGVVMINFVPSFLRAGIPRDAAARSGAYRKRLRSIGASGGLRDSAALAARDRIIAEARRAGLATILDVADHIDHAVRIAGIDHVGLGSDFDGIDYGPVGLGDAADYPYLTRELLNRGYSEAAIRKILGGNFTALFRKICR